MVQAEAAPAQATVVTKEADTAKAVESKAQPNAVESNRIPANPEVVKEMAPVADKGKGKLIYLGSGHTAAQAGGTAAVTSVEDKVKQMGELTQQQRKELRLARFGGNNGKLPSMQQAATTIEALALMEEQKRKKLERAERFGILTKELSEKKIKERQERFGIVTKATLDAKKAERMKRFGTSVDTSQIKVTTDELEAKRKARMERFGVAEVKEAQRSVTVVSDGGK